MCVDGDCARSVTVVSNEVFHTELQCSSAKTAGATVGEGDACSAVASTDLDAARATGCMVDGSSVEGLGMGCCGVCDTPEERAATRLQQQWRAMRPHGGRTLIEQEWNGARARRLGDLVAHVRYLQYVFRRSRELRPGCWRKGGMRGLMSALRLTRSYRCGGGANLAEDAEFEAQRERAGRVLDWYRQYVQLLQRLMSGVTPAVVDDFCGGGDASEGVRRGGGVAHGIDSEVQAEFTRRFGAESFSHRATE